MEEGVKEPHQEKKRASQIVFSVIGVLLCVIFIPVIILNLVMIVRSYTDQEHIPSVFGVSPVIVLSGSMSPTFETGDLILIQKTDPNTLKVNDVICYLEEESAVTHRIMEVQQQDGSTLYITQGDANNTEDATPVTPDKVQGKYMGIRLAGVGEFAMFLQSTQGMLIFIGGPILLFVLWDVLRRVISNRKRSGEKKQLQSEREQLEQELERLRAQVGGDGSGPPSGPADGA